MDHGSDFHRLLVHPPPPPLVWQIFLSVCNAVISYICCLVIRHVRQTCSLFWHLFPITDAVSPMYWQLESEMEDFPFLKRMYGIYSPSASRLGRPQNRSIFKLKPRPNIRKFWWRGIGDNTWNSAHIHSATFEGKETFLQLPQQTYQFQLILLNRSLPHMREHCPFFSNSNLIVTSAVWTLCNTFSKAKKEIGFSEFSAQRRAHQEMPSAY